VGAVDGGALSVDDVIDEVSSIAAKDDVGPSDVLNSGRSGTEDAGEELKYNKRNRRMGIRWEDIRSEDAALRVSETVKAKVYPKPDYQALINDGMQPLIAHVIKQAYDALAAKPQTRSAPTDEDLQLYIAGMNRYMEGVLAWATGPEAIGWLKEIGKRASAMAGAMSGNVTAITDLIDKPKSLLSVVYPEGWKNHRAEIVLLGGNKPLYGLQPGTDEAVKAMKEINKGWPGKREAWQQQGYRVLPGDAFFVDYYSGTEYETKEPYVNVLLRYKDGSSTRELHWERIEGARSEAEDAVKSMAAKMLAEVQGKYVLVDKHFRAKGIHETEQLAQEAAREQTKRGGAKGISEKGISVEMADRDGPIYRKPGENVSSEQLISTFGFRGVNFGNWMKGKGNEAERQLHLNHAFDAFMDLSVILDVPPQALSLDGMLGVAIGAQGNGRAAAHFVPGLNEINITRTAGAGALAHEWGHALDHYFARLAKLERESVPYLSEHANQSATMRRIEFVDGKHVNVERQRFGEDLRPEILAGFKAIVSTMNKRDLTEAEVLKQAESITNNARVQVGRWLSSIERDFMAPSLQGKIRKEDFDRIANKIRDLELGDGKIALSKTTFISPAVDELRTLYKNGTGYTYNADQIKGLQSWVDSLQYRLESKPDTHVPQKTSTTYAMNAAALDKDKGGKPYWSTDIEKFARAFDAYVFDQLEVRAQRNTYLAGLNQDELTSPQGDERKAINAAFSGLVGSLKTKETERGTALFSLGEDKTITQRDRSAIDTATRRMGRFVDEFMAGKLKDSDLQTLGNTPSVLQALGVPNLHLQIDGATIRKVLSSKHSNDIAELTIRNLAEGLYDPLAIFDSADAKAKNAKVILTELTSLNGNPVVAAIHVEKQHGNLLINDVASVHEKSNAERSLASWINKGLLSYVRNETALSDTTRHPLPASIVTLMKGRIGTIQTEADIVKKYGAQFSIDAEDLPLFRENGELLQGAAAECLPRRELEAELLRMKGQWPSMPKVTIVDRAYDLPFSAPAHADGAYFRGDVFLVADNIDSIKHLHKVMAHECILHHSLEEMLGDYGFSKLHEGVMSLKEKGHPVICALSEDIRQRYGVLTPEDETREMVARAGERCLDEKGNLKIGYGWMKSVFAGVTNWLRDHGVSVPFTNLELQGLMHDAGQWIRQDRKQELSREIDKGLLPAVMSKLFSIEKRLEDDWKEQQAWIEQAAKTHGFENIDDFAVKDFHAFERSAAEWREAHPASVLLSLGEQYCPGTVSKGDYVGRIVKIEDGVAIQNVGRDRSVRHDVSKLEGKIQVGELAEIRYVQGVGKVGGRQVGNEVGR
jgi:hypothetical protein